MISSDYFTASDARGSVWVVAAGRAVSFVAAFAVFGRVVLEAD
jgi:hypothetical protein